MTETLDQLLEAMTTEEKIQLLTGADFFASEAIPRLGIPAFQMSDGPHGVRAQEAGKADHLGLNASAAATCFPSGAAMASGWNPDLARQVAGAIGEEARHFGIRVMLGPAFNIKRSPLCGRNFEYYSEDPYLAGRLAASFVKGMQSQGVAACPKHFAANSQEDRRMVSNSVVDERTLREIYLPAFEMAVKEGNPWSIMCSYNRVNGTFASENPWLLRQVLRQEWGFDGAVISDWGAVSNRAKALLGGLDLEMPGTNGYSAQVLRRALEQGEITQEDLDFCVRNLLRLIARTEGAAPAETVDWAEHHALAREAAEECLVLLKNEGQLLPLAKEGKIAVIGELARCPRYQGGGSSHVSSWKVDNTLEELKAHCGQAEITYAEGYNLEDGEELDSTRLEEAAELARAADAVLLFVGLTEQYETEGSDRTNLNLPKAHNELARRVLAANPNTAVILTAGAPVELPWVDQAKAILSTYTAGDGLGGAVARILFGEVNPSGKLAETMPLRLEHNPAYLNFRESPQDIRYQEGVFVGYRWYEKRQLPVLFPFGHGLSYTTFAYSNLTLSQSSIHEWNTLTVTADITNTGSWAGRECVQLYVADQVSSLPRPVKELKGFAKISLKPGETKTVTFTLNRRDFAFYDTQLGDWAVESGLFRICLGASSADIRLVGEVSVEAVPWRPLTRVTQETTYGELVRDKRTYPLICRYLSQSPMYRPDQMPDAGDFLLNMPLWTLNHMAGRPVTPQLLEEWIGELNRALEN